MRRSELSDGINNDSSDARTEGLVCFSNGHGLTPVFNPLQQFSSRSVWFQRRAIFIVAVFLAIFIVLIIGLAVFLRDRGPLPEAEEPVFSDEYKRIKDLLLSPKQPKAVFRPKLRRRRRTFKRSPTQSTVVSRSEPATRATDQESPQEDHILPPLEVVYVTPRGTILSDEELTSRHPAPAPTPSDPSTLGTSPGLTAAVSAPTVPASSRLDESDVEAVNQLPIEYEAAQPPSYVTISRPHAPTAAKASPLPESASRSLDGHLPEPRTVSAADPDSHTLAAHVATDEKSMLHALHTEASAPSTQSLSVTIPSAPPWHSIGEHSEHDGSAMPGPSLPMDTPVSPRHTSRMASDLFPPPPEVFEPSVREPTVLLETTNAHSSKAHEAAQEQSWLSTLLPSQPSLPDMTESPSAPHMVLPLYERDPGSQIDLELGLGPSAPSLPSEPAFDGESVIPSAPDMDTHGP
ncbi:hypothetical protein MNAN1_001600 [Malassezia nana]|uniref:Transmembrane protein n=1 Tax=Malassezia nana TaxID=180528 RepID=A0AAF0J238_9BASI|nr:hypothetical protein MNAN1_001600 [Malassezia nana]